MGGHSVTGRHRSKRPDARLPPKQRRSAKKKEEDKKLASDLRVVKIKKSERKERATDSWATRLAKPKLSNVEKKAKALAKKLQQIDALKARQEAGEVMDCNQLAKIASEDEVREDLKAWEDAAVQGKLCRRLSEL